MNIRTCALLVAIACLGALTTLYLYSGPVNKTQQSILDQNSVDTIEAQEKAFNAPHPDFPPPTFEALLAQAEQGNAQAQYLLGQRYNFGDGVTQDRKKAVAWQTRAATQGHATAQYVLGLMYSAGEGVPQDTGQAVVWISRSADQGLAEAQHALGMMYQNGKDVPRDPEKAMALLRKAAAQGNKGAQRDLSENKAYP